MKDAHNYISKNLFYNGKDVLITGGDGFIGKHLVEALHRSGANITVLTRKNKSASKNMNVSYVHVDLTNFEQCKKKIPKTEIVFHLAGIAGGIKFNKKFQGSIFNQNTIINSNILKLTSNYVKRFQFVSSVAVYPITKNYPLMEKDGMVGEPEPVNYGYGWSKRVGELQCKMFAEEFGIKMSIIRPDNTYGPFDNFDLKNARIIPSLIRKVVEAKNKITVWGSGNQSRSFVYVDDLINGMIIGLSKYSKSEPINISSGVEIKIKEIIKKIVNISGKDLRIEYDTTKPEGMKRRVLSITKAKRDLKFKPKWSLQEGLTNTIKWYEKNRHIKNADQLIERYL